MNTSIGHAMLMTPNKAETAVHGCLIPARVIWLCACVRRRPHHGSGVSCVHLVINLFQLRIPFSVYFGKLGWRRGDQPHLSLLWWYVDPVSGDLSVIITLHHQNSLFTEGWVVFAQEFSFLLRSKLVTRPFLLERKNPGKRLPTFLLPRYPLLSFASIIWDVTQCSPNVSFGEALRDIPKNGCEGD